MSVRVGICGAGVMGSGIATTALLAGWSVVLYDISADILQKAKSAVEKNLGVALSKGKVTDEQHAAALAAIAYTGDLADFGDVALVVEAVVEKLDVKVDIFRRLESIVPPEAVLSSNTSSISISSIARHLASPERFVGMHFFNPAHVMKLVEVIKGHKTSPEVVEQVRRWSEELGKTPAVAADVPGFIVNRVARNYYNEAMRIVTESGATIQQVDSIMKSQGFKMGPFELMDLIGVDTNLEVTKSIWTQYFYEPRFQPSLMQQQYVDAGLYGRKTGEGFYKYEK